MDWQSCTAAWWIRMTFTVWRRFCWRRWFTTRARSDAAAPITQWTWWRRSTWRRSTALWGRNWPAPVRRTAANSWRWPGSTISWVPAGCRWAVRWTFRHCQGTSCRPRPRVPCDRGLRLLSLTQSWNRNSRSSYQSIGPVGSDCRSVASLSAPTYLHVRTEESIYVGPWSWKVCGNWTCWN